MGEGFTPRVDSMGVVADQGYGLPGYLNIPNTRTPAPVEWRRLLEAFGHRKSFPDDYHKNQ
jgi:hypothetical protein